MLFPKETALCTIDFETPEHLAPVEQMVVATIPKSYKGVFATFKLSDFPVLFNEALMIGTKYIKHKQITAAELDIPIYVMHAPERSAQAIYHKIAQSMFVLTLPEHFSNVEAKLKSGDKTWLKKFAKRRILEEGQTIMHEYVHHLQFAHGALSRYKKTKNILFSLTNLWRRDMKFYFSDPAEIQAYYEEIFYMQNKAGITRRQACLNLLYSLNKYKEDSESLKKLIAAIFDRKSASEEISARAIAETVGHPAMWAEFKGADATEQIKNIGMQINQLRLREYTKNGLPPEVASAKLTTLDKVVIVSVLAVLTTASAYLLTKIYKWLKPRAKVAAEQLKSAWKEVRSHKKATPKAKAHLRAMVLSLKNPDLVALKHMTAGQKVALTGKDEASDLHLAVNKEMRSAAGRWAIVVSEFVHNKGNPQVKLGMWLAGKSTSMVDAVSKDLYFKIRIDFKSHADQITGVSVIQGNIYNKEKQVVLVTEKTTSLKFDNQDRKTDFAGSIVREILPTLQEGTKFQEINQSKRKLNPEEKKAVTALGLALAVLSIYGLMKLFKWIKMRSANSAGELKAAYLEVRKRNWKIGTIIPRQVKVHLQRAVGALSDADRKKLMPIVNKLRAGEHRG